MTISNARNLSLLATAFIATAFNIEWNGYEAFEKEDGGNYLCDIDPKCRNLTKDEVEIAELVYGDTINYASVKVFDRSYLFFPDIFNERSHAPNGNIYLSEQKRREVDLSEEFTNQSFFIHEMGHVWQFHKDKDPRLSAIPFLEVDKLVIDYNAEYEYSLDEGISFHDYNLEQQASIFADYFKELNRNPKNARQIAKFEQLQNLVEEATGKVNNNNSLATSPKVIL